MVPFDCVLVAGVLIEADDVTAPFAVSVDNRFFGERHRDSVMVGADWWSAESEVVALFQPFVEGWSHGSTVEWFGFLQCGDSEQLDSEVVAEADFAETPRVGVAFGARQNDVDAVEYRLFVVRGGELNLQKHLV
ncbi:MAG: hypothetical protein EBT75_01240 [Proteobacteria bacterium]|nr:hypothetical protein [Pseudomonadota bacterium]NBS49314.1 hypothetical protein [Verrucomicrobiota bacterium]